MTSLFCSLESAPFCKNFKKIFEKIEKMLNFLNYFIIQEVWAPAAKGRSFRPAEVRIGILFPLLEDYGKHSR